jgi:hypothetical protein
VVPDETIRNSQILSEKRLIRLGKVTMPTSWVVKLIDKLDKIKWVFAMLPVRGFFNGQ